MNPLKFYTQLVLHGFPITCRNERKKLEEELAEWNRKVAELTAETGEAAVQRLHDEIKDCRAILKCSVCLDRPKEVSINIWLGSIILPCMTLTLVEVLGTLIWCYSY